MRKIFALPGILLPLSILGVGIFIGNTSLDIHMHDTVFTPAFDLATEKYAILLTISWVFHIVLSYKKLIGNLLGWLHVLISTLCLFVFYLHTWHGFATMPRRYYDYDIEWRHKIFGVNDSFQELCAVVFIAVQIIFWVYCIITLTKASVVKNITGNGKPH